MTSVPLFVPAGADRVAAVVTAPEGELRGLVLVLAGTGRHNVIGSTLAAKLAERLAGEGLASVRLDYAGVGDSPGLVPTWTPSEIEAVRRQARAAVAETCAALGVTRFAGVGTCYGSRVVLSMVGDPACAGAVCLAPPFVDHAGWRRPGGRGARGRLYSLLRRSQTVRRLARPLLQALPTGKPSAGAVGALAHLERVRLAFLYGPDGTEDHYSAEVAGSIQATLAQLPSEQRARFELHFLEAGPLTTFDGLSLDDQERILAAVVPHVLRCFEAGDVPVPGGRPMTAAPGEGPVDVLLVCSSGGHLLQLVALTGAWEGYSSAWATFDKSDARSLLAAERVYYAHGPTNRNLKNLGRNVPFAWRLLRRLRPRVIVTTGAGVAVPFAWLGRLLGARVAYVESVTRMDGRASLSCRLIRPVADRVYVQWPELAERLPGSRYCGGIFSPR